MTDNTREFKRVPSTHRKLVEVVVTRRPDALYAESEQLVQRGLEAAMRNRTTLIIAHRLSTVQRADRIVVLEQGRIVEVGTPAELMSQGGLYARLTNLQLVA